MKDNNILYIEDNEDDILLLERALRKEGMKEALHVMRDGSEAIAWLSGDGDYEHRDKYPMPQLVLLDLYLPKIDRFAVLRWIRSQPALAPIPVIILSGAYQEGDVAATYRLGADLFLAKPPSLDEMRRVARLLRAWIDRSLMIPDYETTSQGLVLRRH